VHVYVDEPKSGAYLLVASRMTPPEAAAARRLLRQLYLPGQSRLHMKSESHPRRRKILRVLETAGLSVTFYRAVGPATDIAARAECVTQLVRDLATEPNVWIVFESDESQDDLDRRQLAGLLKELEAGERIRYEHRRAASEPLLAIPDIVGWAYARGGEFRRRAEPLVSAIVDVRP